MAIASTSRPVRRWPFVAAVVAVGLGGLLAGVLLTRDGDPATTVDSATQVASVQHACQQWMGTTETMMGDPSWCAGMSDWMNQAMANGTMGPAMMWGDPAQMQTTCQQWMATSPPAGASIDPSTWCTSMVTWMTEHMQGWSGNDSWDGWMMNGTMMGR